MKLIYFGENSHHKNSSSIKRMCESLKIEFENSLDYSRLSKPDYHIIIFHSFYVDSEETNIPSYVKIIYGPQHWVFPQGKLVGNLDDKFTSRCVYNTLSEWNTHVYMEMVGSLIVPFVEFPFSVETDKFKPNTTIKSIDCIVYIKRRDPQLVKSVLDNLKIRDLSYKVFTYGSYQECEYLETLHCCKFLISIDAHESQGFALEEAMSCNIPLLVIDALSMYDEISNGDSTYKHLKPKKLLATSVPYWNDKCGIKIANFKDFDISLDTMLKTWNDFTPRDYILENLTDEICMKRILNYFNIHVIFL